MLRISDNGEGVELNSIQVKNSGYEVKFWYEAANGMINGIGFGCDELADIELVNAMDSFKIHVIRDTYMGGLGLVGKDIKDMTEDQQKYMYELMKKMTIKKVEITGKKSDRVKITASIKGINEDTKPLVTGKLQFFNSQKAESYKYWQDLETSVATLKHEIIKYVNTNG